MSINKPSNKDSQCYFVQLQIDSYLDGDLGDSQQAAFMTHIHDCQDCASELSFARRVHDTLLDLPMLDCPATALEPVDRLGGNEHSTAGWWAGLADWLQALPTSVRYAIPAAAAVVLTVLLMPEGDQSLSGDNLVAAQNETEEYTQEDVVAALRDLNTAINYLNEVSQRTETMVGGRFVLMPLQESLNASFDRVQEDVITDREDDPVY